MGAAVALPFFDRLLSFFGAFCTGFVSIVFPAAAGLVLLRDEMGRLEWWGCGVVVVVGMVVMVWGTVVVFVVPLK